jgi:hypothetical protein
MILAVSTPGSAPPDSRHIDEEGVLDRQFLAGQTRFRKPKLQRGLVAPAPSAPKCGPE